ncbi:MAG: helix-turn-helix domain-containing protein, partial [Clostridia bacterium]|nr:helix-turn-helix domain-containing protein [Clostridia bacterium]
MTFGEKLKDLRKEMGLKQTELAKQIGVGKS